MRTTLDSTTPHFIRAEEPQELDPQVLAAQRAIAQAMSAPQAGYDAAAQAEPLRAAFAALLGVDLERTPPPAPMSPEQLMGAARLATALATSRGNPEVARQLLEARLPGQAPAQGDGGLGGAATGQLARRALDVAGHGAVERYVPEVGRDGVAGALQRARLTGKSQQLELNKAIFTVHPTDSREIAGARYDAARRAPMAFEPPVGKDAFAAAAEEAKRTGRVQAWQHAPTARASVRPGESAEAAFARFSAEAKVAAPALGATRELGKVAAAGARILGKVAVPLGLAADALDIGRAMERDGARADGARTETTRAVGRAAGGWGGAAAGAAAGAAFGSVVPVVGTAIGAVLGGVAGGFGGSEFGELIAGAL